MNEHNMIRTNHQVLEYASMQQLHNHHQPDPRAIAMPPPSLNMNNFNLHHQPDLPTVPVYYGLAHYNQTNHPTTNLELRVPQPSTYLTGHFNPTLGTPTPFHVSHNHGFADHLPSSSNYQNNEVPFGEHGREICKRKSVVHHFSSSVGPSSSSTALIGSGHFDCVHGGIDVQLGYNDYRSNSTLPMDSGMVHDFNNYLVQGNYGGRCFQPSSCTLMEQQSFNNGGALSWNAYNPMLTYFPASNIHGSSSESGNAGLPRYLEPPSYRPPMIQQHPSLHLPQNISGVRGYVTCYPPTHFAPPHSRVPPNDDMQHDAMHLSSETAAEAVAGIRMHHPHGRSSIVPDALSRRHDLPRLRTLQTHRVALPEFPSFFEADYEMENFIDHHRDMRLDIDDMSYEELLELSEQIGSVSTGLSEEDIRSHLKTRLYSSTVGAINLELPCIDLNNDSCIICQDEYEETDKLGILECGHEYHVECLKKWLLIKNVCPVCKSTALTTISNNR